jgi:branched-chain amino acid transport system ATP-binding protein
MLVEHHMDLVMSVCHDIVVLDFGKVIARGGPDEIRASTAVTDAYLGAEAPPEAAPIHDDASDETGEGE